MKKYQTCNGCYASRERKSPGSNVIKFKCALGYSVGWAGNPEEPCPKPKSMKEYFTLPKKGKADDRP